MIHNRLCERLPSPLGNVKLSFKRFLFNTLHHFIISNCRFHVQYVDVFCYYTQINSRIGVLAAPKSRDLIDKKHINIIIWACFYNWIAKAFARPKYQFLSLFGYKSYETHKGLSSFFLDWIDHIRLTKRDKNQFIFSPWRQLSIQQFQITILLTSLFDY